MSDTLKEIQGKLEDRRKKLAEVYKEAGPELDFAKVKSLDGADDTLKIASLKALNDEIDDLAKQAEPLQAEESEKIRGQKNLAQLGEIQPHPGHSKAGGQRYEAPKSLGQQFVESAAYKDWHRGMGNGPRAELDVGIAELKANFVTTAGWAPESLRTGLVVPSVQFPLRVIDLVSRATTTSAAVNYMEETTLTNNAAERVEAAIYVESALALTARTVPVQSIGTSLPISDEQLEDVAQAQSYVEGRIGFMVNQRLDSQLINGNAGAPNIRGFLAASGLQTQAKGGDSTPDAIYKAMVKVEVTGGAVPSAFITHPNDWQAVRLLTTIDGVYIWGSPADAGPDRIWGIPVIRTTAIAENTGLVGDFSALCSQLFIRRGLEVQIGFTGANFVDGLQTVRAGLRCANVIYRGLGFCTVTGI